MATFGLFCLSHLTVIDPELVESLAHQAGEPALLVEYFAVQQWIRVDGQKISQQGACVEQRGW